MTAPTTSPLDGTSLRRAIADYAADLDDLGWLHARWGEHNAAHFDGALIPPIIALSEPSMPRRLGQFAKAGGTTRQPEITIRPSLLTGTHPGWARGSTVDDRRRLVDDVLLHECVHQWTHEVSGQTDVGYHGHGPAFRDRANEIGARLGLPLVRTSKARGEDAGLPSCSQWPHCVRPTDWYGGQWRARRSPRRTVDTVRVGLESAFAALEVATAAGESLDHAELAPLADLANEIRQRLSQLTGTGQ